MQRLIGAVAAMAMLSGCATTPQRAVGQLDQSDPKYHTDECIQGRNLALQFDNKVFTRIGTGMALGLLGPFGLPMAIGADSYQNDQRKQMDAELARRCRTAPGEIVPVAAPKPMPLPVKQPESPPRPLHHSCGGIRVYGAPDAISCD